MIRNPRCRTFLLGLLIQIIGMWSAPGQAAEEPGLTLRPKSSEHPAALIVTGLPSTQLKSLSQLKPDDPAFPMLLTVHVATEIPDPNLPPIGGSYRVDQSQLVFTPRYPLRPGLKYRVTLQRVDKSPLEREVSLPKLRETVMPLAHVEQIYPSGDVLPENHLRFYVHFSQPVARGEAYQHLELLDSAGAPVTGAFLELGEELWDPHGKRFTLLLDPGRIKQGLKPREDLGPILKAGHKYTLLVKRSWHDLHGRKLAAEYRKPFSVGPAIDEPVDVSKWKLNQPGSGTRDALVIRFPRPLDRALLERLLVVVDRQGKAIPGQIAVTDAERRWEFRPESAWTGEGYQLVVETVLEDTAGNSIGRPFEVDEQRPITKIIATETVRIPITTNSNVSH